MCIKIVVVFICCFLYQTNSRLIPLQDCCQKLFFCFCIQNARRKIPFNQQNSLHNHHILNKGKVYPNLARLSAISTWLLGTWKQNSELFNLEVPNFKKFLLLRVTHISWGLQLCDSICKGAIVNTEAGEALCTSNHRISHHHISRKLGSEVGTIRSSEIETGTTTRQPVANGRYKIKYVPQGFSMGESLYQSTFCLYASPLNGDGKIRSNHGLYNNKSRISRQHIKRWN